ncbi:MAG TPA: hypothetical protein VEL68_01515 [Thermodesulfobacteriota bacterium]|nr:hypothetical protein [Thermodesulfobacteriota bacterium]
MRLTILALLLMVDFPAPLASTMGTIYSLNIEGYPVKSRYSGIGYSRALDA